MKKLRIILFLLLGFIWGQWSAPDIAISTICGPAKIAIREMSSLAISLRGWNRYPSYPSRRNMVGFGSPDGRRDG